MEAIKLNWVGGEHEFALTLGELRALQQVCDAGPEQILNRILDSKWLVDDLYNVVRLGLIGGGMESTVAAKLATEMFDQNGLVSFKLPTQAILISALVGPEDDQVGEREGEGKEPHKWQFSEFYGAGAVMGFTPTQINAMSVWEFMACIDGIAAKNGVKKPSAAGDNLDEKELAAMGIEGF